MILNSYKNIDELSKFLESFNWAWYTTLTMPYMKDNPEGLKQEFVNKLFHEWVLEIIHEEKIAVGYFSASNVNLNNHIHALMLGSRFNFNSIGGKTLKDIDPDYWKKRWCDQQNNSKNNYRNKKALLIGQKIDTFIREKFDVAGYIEQNGLMGCSHRVYGTKILDMHRVAGVPMSGRLQYRV